MQVNVAGLRRNIKNLAHNYSDAQVKVREATSNDPWGPSAAIMAEIADLTYNVVAFSEIMQMIWKRLNDHGKNWRHVYKALILLEYLIKTGTEKVAQQCKENIFAIQTLREFVYYEEGKDQGTHVREKAKQLVNLLKDDERLKNERIKALKAKERFAQHPSGFGSDGYIDGPSHRDMPPGWQEDPPKPVSDLELVRPQTAGEEELQLKLAMAMSREEAEQEEAKRRSDDVRLQLALSQSEQDFKEQTVRPSKREEQQSHLLDLLDISLGAASISSPPLGATGGMGGSDPWVTGPARAASQQSDPWSGTSSPQIDPWQPTAMAMRSNTSSVPLGASGGLSSFAGIGGAATSTNGDAWALRTQSPSIASGSSTEGWLHSNGNAGAAASMNGNTSVVGGGAATATAVGDPWLGKTTAASLAATQPLTTTTGGNMNVDPWLGDAPPKALAQTSAEKSLSLDDPWAPKTMSDADDPWKNLASTGAIKKTSPDLDEFDIISNRKKTAEDLLTDDLLSGPNNNNTTMEVATTNGKKPLKTPQAFLGENSSLVNLDNLIKPIVPQTQPGSAAYNPFSDTVIPPKTNLFQQQQPAVPSINQLKQQQPFSMAVNQDPWAPISNAGSVSQQVKENPFVYEIDEQLTTSKDRYSALIEPMTTPSVFNMTIQKNEENYLNYYQNYNNNNKNARSSDSDDEIFNTAYVPYHYMNNQEQHFNNKNINYGIYENFSFQQNHEQKFHSIQKRNTAENIGNLKNYTDACNMPRNFKFNAYNNNKESNDFSDDAYYYLKSSLSSFPISANATLGGSLFNYGFYDANYEIYNNNNNQNRNYALTSSTSANSFGCNNNNNNMSWIKPEAASSNPFLS